MPNEYTAGIEKDITFEEFVMKCAQAFGATLSMRDDQLDAQIPNQFYPRDYHANMIAVISAHINKLSAMTEEEAEIYAKDTYDAAMTKRADEAIRNDMLINKYKEMLNKVEAWQPPSSDHHGLKNFMIEQITSSIIDFDSNENYYRENKIKKLTGHEFRSQELSKAQRDLAYHKHENDKEILRTEKRNTWVKKLRESLNNASA